MSESTRTATPFPLPPNLARLAAHNDHLSFCDCRVCGALADARVLVEESSRLKERLRARMDEIQTEKRTCPSRSEWRRGRGWMLRCGSCSTDLAATPEDILHAPDCPWALDMWLAGRTDVKIREAKGDE